MIEKVDVGVAPSSAPVSDCVRAGKHVWLVAIAEDPATGEIVQGDIEIQTRQTLSNLQRAIIAAGGSMADIAQVQVFLTDKRDAPGMNAVYRQYFAEPYPVRATIIAGLLAEGLKVEMLAMAVLS